MKKWNKCHQPPTCTKVMPAVVHPTKCNVTQKTCEYIVPEVHPTHTTHVTNHVYKHVHSFPHTDSFKQTISSQQFVGHGPGPQVAGAMMPPRPPMGGYGPQAMGPMAGANMGPMGFGPQAGANMGPNMGPMGFGPQAGANMAPNMGPTAGAYMGPMGKDNGGCGCTYR
ncbi:CotD family spore coat protein [Alkalihalophilus lindianensis]|uniref:CotD family spore coat protein n=1 Tax=Alkalihalophilus lindianensis TaxID=1630542 RepID=A0ABU3X6Q9_9BACI|nr:CotD family spore coat protein [Alkalihalophilus lindianensis]MDV2683575.1 CotD family spore coat protein [Alkalihalophilus lindianensis]